MSAATKGPSQSNMSQSMSEKLSRTVHYLFEEFQDRRNERHQHAASCSHCVDTDTDWIDEMDTWGQLEALRKLLCQRPPVPPLPVDVLEDIDKVIQHQNSHVFLTSSRGIPPYATISRGRSSSPSSQPINLLLWKGDITTLTDVTAIVNAANSQLLGCFRPEHRCIDNVIHSAAGPRLRNECYSLMRAQGHPEPVGSVKVTPGFNLPAQWVLHTVGPQVDASKQQVPDAAQQQELAACYVACLEAAEKLPPLPDGRKVVAFCCISTGVFAFPAALAADIAVETVVTWCRTHPETTLTDIIFDVFLERDRELYEKLTKIATVDDIDISLCHQEISEPSIISLENTPATAKARKWLQQADYLIISAGAGLSAAIGLDYTSPELFRKHFPAFLSLGLRRLYDAFGFDAWDPPQQEWGYHFTRLALVRSWPPSRLYARLLRLVNNRFGTQRYFVRTSNADGQFVANGFEADRVATPQGQYRYLQCLSKCRRDAVFLADPFIDAALPAIDPQTQVLRDASKIPYCAYCGDQLTVCVRGGDYFNPEPFQDQERKWAAFLRQVKQDGSSRTVILELGVGMNTPGVLRWPNEELVEEYPDAASD
ncbi:hypothetical protein VTN77DRAFT_5010 [Rasamsonia byssochlamydoides]|uniref:uncharacterized protein n=1 Tax=Rasamsonia byssochlamydoides TaxID=89139 RepID=UPI003742F409